jgi:hypothetical protein
LCHYIQTFHETKHFCKVNTKHEFKTHKTFKSVLPIKVLYTNQGSIICNHLKHYLNAKKRSWEKGLNTMNSEHKSWCFTHTLGKGNVNTEIWIQLCFKTQTQNFTNKLSAVYYCLQPGTLWMETLITVHISQHHKFQFFFNNRFPFIQAGTSVLLLHAFDIAQYIIA